VVERSFGEGEVGGDPGVEKIKREKKGVER
jgi:hypothetical protein